MILYFNFFLLFIVCIWCIHVAWFMKASVAEKLGESMDTGNHTIINFIYLLMATNFIIFIKALLSY